MDAINLEDVFQKRIGVLQCCPHKGRFRNASRVALQERHDAVVAGDRQRQIRAWKAFTLFPFMLLQRSQGQRNEEKDELCARLDKFGQNSWRRHNIQLRVPTTEFQLRTQWNGDPMPRCGK